MAITMVLFELLTIIWLPRGWRTNAHYSVEFWGDNYLLGCGKYYEDKGQRSKPATVISTFLIRLPVKASEALWKIAGPWGNDFANNFAWEVLFECLTTLLT